MTLLVCPECRCDEYYMKSHRFSTTAEVICVECNNTVAEIDQQDMVNHD